MKHSRAFIPVIAILAALAGNAGAQGVRGDLRAAVSWVEYRPLIREAIPESAVAGDGTTRVLPDGTVVVCVPGGDCYYYRPGGVKDTTPFVQDLRFTAWPGWRGISSRVHIRSRTGGDTFWPRGAQDLLALNAYVDFDRTAFRVRAGRQDRLGGLGSYYFDGASAVWRQLRELRLEAFAGRSLARNNVEPLTGSLLAEADDLPPDKGSVLWGLEGRFVPSRRLSGTVIYQRELRTDRAGLYSERMALDAAWAAPRTTVTFSSDFDVAFAAFNDARLNLRRSIGPRVDASVEGRYYRPFFELWTIWGAFSPVGFTEGRASAGWNAAPGLRLEGSGSYRNYEDTSTESEFIPIEGDGWHARALARWVRDDWNASVAVDVHRGFGAFASSLDFTAGRNLDSRTYVGIYGVGTQQFAEFRFGEGVTRGGGVEARSGRGRLSVDANLGLYRHTFENQPQYSDYNQGRGRLGVTVTFGSEPALPKSVYGKAAGS